MSKKDKKPRGKQKEEFKTSPLYRFMVEKLENDEEFIKYLTRENEIQVFKLAPDLGLVPFTLYKVFKSNHIGLKTSRALLAMRPATDNKPAFITKEELIDFIL